MEKVKLIEMRKTKSFSQKYMAEKLSIDASNYNRREKGEMKISKQEWEKIAKIFGIPFEDIYESEESRIFIFNDNATGNGDIVNDYNIPLSIWETQKKYIEILEKETQTLKQQIIVLKQH